MIYQVKGIKRVYVGCVQVFCCCHFASGAQAPTILHRVLVQIVSPLPAVCTEEKKEIRSSFKFFSCSIGTIILNSFDITTEFNIKKCIAMQKATSGGGLSCKTLMDQCVGCERVRGMNCRISSGE